MRLPLVPLAVLAAALPLASTAPSTSCTAWSTSRSRPSAPRWWSGKRAPTRAPRSQLLGGGVQFVLDHGRRTATSAPLDVETTRRASQDGESAQLRYLDQEVRGPLTLNYTRAEMPSGRRPDLWGSRFPNPTAAVSPGGHAGGAVADRLPCAGTGGIGGGAVRRRCLPLNGVSPCCGRRWTLRELLVAPWNAQRPA